MLRIATAQIGVAFEKQGCPKHGRHGGLGPGDNPVLSEDDVRWGLGQFREFLAQADTSVRWLRRATWFREPDSREDAYARWAESVGPDARQMSFSGLREANDWFYRRKGAFDDARVATRRLLDAGMKPRWQCVHTTKRVASDSSEPQPLKSMRTGLRPPAPSTWTTGRRFPGVGATRRGGGASDVSGVWGGGHRPASRQG